MWGLWNQRRPRMFGMRLRIFLKFQAKHLNVYKLIRALNFATLWSKSYSKTTISLFSHQKTTPPKLVFVNDSIRRYWKKSISIWPTRNQGIIYRPFRILCLPTITPIIGLSGIDQRLWQHKTSKMCGTSYILIDNRTGQERLPNLNTMTAYEYWHKGNRFRKNTTAAGQMKYFILKRLIDKPDRIHMFCGIQPELW